MEDRRISDKRLKELYRDGLKALFDEGDYDAVMAMACEGGEGSDQILEEVRECRKMLVWNALAKVNVEIDDLSDSQWLNIYEICTGKKI